MILPSATTANARSRPTCCDAEMPDPATGDAHGPDGPPRAVLRGRSAVAVGEAGQRLGTASNPLARSVGVAAIAFSVVYLASDILEVAQGD